MKLSLSRSLALALACATAAGACTREPPGPAGIREPEPKRGGTLRVSLTEDVDSLDPHRGLRPSAWFFARALHRGLLAYPNAAFPAGANPVADLANEMPVVDQGGRRYTFTLRGATFPAPVSRAVTASDVRASIARVLRVDRGVARFLWDIRGARAYAGGNPRALTGVRVVDPRTLQIVLTRPGTDLLSVLAHPQVAVIAPGTPLRVQPSRIVGLGPYVLRTYDPERTIVLRRNEAWQENLDPVRLAHVEEIRASVIDGDPYEGVARGDADVVVEPGPLDVIGEPPSGARVARVAGSCIRYAWSTSRSTASALRAAASSSQLRTDTDATAGADRLLPPTVFRGERDVVEGRGSARVDATITVGSSTRDRREATALRRAVERTGGRLRVEIVPQASLLGVYGSGRARAGLATWCADWPGLAARNVLGAVSSIVVRGPQPCAAPETVRLAISQPSVATDFDAWGRADAVIQARCGVVPLYWPVERVVLSDRLRGFRGAPMFPRGDPAGLWLA